MQTVKYLKEIKWNVHTFHKGLYEYITKAYESIINYAKDNNITLKGNVYEKYYESFNFRSKSENYLAEIIMPIE